MGPPWLMGVPGWVPTEPINTFHGIQHNEDEPIRVSYHRNIHYNSVVNPNKATIGVGLGLPSFKPGVRGGTPPIWGRGALNLGGGTLILGGGTPNFGGRDLP